MALLVFGEYLDRASKAASLLIIGGTIMLGFGPGAIRADAIGAAWIAGACALWAIDNNLTQRLTNRDPFAIVRAKATVAAISNLTIATARGGHWPHPHGLELSPTSTEIRLCPDWSVVHGWYMARKRSRPHSEK